MQYGGEKEYDKSRKLDYKLSSKTVQLKLPWHANMLREMNSITEPLSAENNKQLSSTFNYSSTPKKKKILSQFFVETKTLLL